MWPVCTRPSVVDEVARPPEPELGEVGGAVGIGFGQAGELGGPSVQRRQKSEAAGHGGMVGNQLPAAQGFVADGVVAQVLAQAAQALVAAGHDLGSGGP